jgi:hypothetical protein
MKHHHLQHWIIPDPTLKNKSYKLFMKLCEQHKVYSKAFEVLHKNFPVNFSMELLLITPTPDNYNLKLLLYELQVFKHLNLLTESESETLFSLILSEDVSSEFIGLSILANKLKEKEKLEKKGSKEKEFNDIVAKYYDIVYVPANAKFVELSQK